ncbi:nitroreductase family protein [Ruminococcus albus]|uniref:Nitroreductase n=1 Tax=Ruminococcus albus (strain ATCC 27210 / DSM 20455 / JCM 14654 / NCDO 2250 / 7) TaxID=697329 RepID=E6UKM0_RUMA7|nr:nitroreductase [Ruminococcus albus]ADU24216.1 nitroreductase [Ruminococcus albus 7 = DSM 20455]
MNTLEAIKTRRSTRRFSDKRVEVKKLNWIVDAGRYAPSGGNSQSCHFIVVRKKEVLAKLAELAQAAFDKKEITEGMYKSVANSIRASKKGGYVFHYDPDTLIIVANKKDYGNNIADTACALENMMIAANELDLGSVWINQLRWLNEDETLLEYERSLGLEDNERIYGALAIGYADTEDGLPVRTPLERTGNKVTYI